MDILAIIFPMLFIPLVGYSAVGLRYLQQVETDALAKLTFNCLIPALLFISTSQADLQSNVPWQFFLSYYGAVVVIYLSAVVLGARLFGFNHAEQSVFGMGAAYSNITILGIPLCAYGLGKDALLPLFMLISVHNLLLFLLGILLSERGNLTLQGLFRQAGLLLLQLAKNPITGSLLLGIAVNLSGLAIYAPLLKGVDLISHAALPIALFVLGASLHKYRIRGAWYPACVIVVFKNIALPSLVAFLAVGIFALPTLWAASAILAASMPVGISAYVFSQRYAAGEAVLSSALVLSTLCSVITISFVLTWIT